MKKQYSLSVEIPNILRYNPLVINGWKVLKCTALADIKDIKGTTIKLQYMRVKYNNILLQALFFIHLYCELKEVIYWNPNKNVIANSTKYSNVGPKSRGPHSMLWFEVSDKNEIYEVGMDKYVYSTKLPLPFPGTHLDRVTSKRLKIVLDELLYQNK